MAKTRRTYKNKVQTRRKSQRKNVKGGCGCNNTKGGNTNYNNKLKGGCGACNGMKGGFGKASFQPFEQTSGQYYYGASNINSDPNMPTTMSSGRFTPMMRGGRRRRRSTKIKKMRGGDLLLGNNQSNLPLSFGTTGGSIASVNTLSGVPNLNSNAFSQPGSTKFNEFNPPMV